MTIERWNELTEWRPSTQNLELMLLKKEVYVELFENLVFFKF